MHLQRRNRFAYLLVLPSFTLVLMLNLFPLAQGLVTSLQRQNLTRPGAADFIGLANYVRALFGEAVFWPSLFKTLIWTGGVVIGAYALGLGLALLLNLPIRGRPLLRALFLIPWVVPEAVSALLWRWLYNDEYGVINFLLLRLHLVDEPIRWLAVPAMAMPAVIIAQIWKAYPLMTVVLLAALQSVPRELHEAAMLDGARTWQRFFYVTFPYIRTTSIAITLLTAIWTFQSFDLIYLLTGGGPANATQILPILVYQKAFASLDLGYAASLGVLMLMIMMVLSSLYTLISRSSRTADA